jgi:tRNA A37 threonylcarbamoyltransferase TsaD
MRLGSIASFSSRMLENNIFVPHRKLSTLISVHPKQMREGIGLPKGTVDAKSRYKLEQECLSGLPLKHPFLVLGIESSCDDTGVAVVSSDGSILSNVVFSQHTIHEKFGGVVPSLAMEAHRSNIDLAIEKAIREAGLSSIHDIDAIAVTKGPGLEICLRIGCRKAQALAKEYSKPFVTVHHLEAHCLIARLAGTRILPPTSTTSSTPSKAKNSTSIASKVDFPFLVLLASGGHTSLLICKGLGEYDLLGGTLDDALGEAFDKAARLLGLKMEQSGGVAIEQLAKHYEEHYLHKNHSLYTHSMSVPMKDKPNCDFSYAGLKNAFRKEVLKHRQALGLDMTQSNAPTGQMEIAQEVVVSYSQELNMIVFQCIIIEFTR